MSQVDVAYYLTTTTTMAATTATKTTKTTTMTATTAKTTTTASTTSLQPQNTKTRDQGDEGWGSRRRRVSIPWYVFFIFLF